MLSVDHIEYYSRQRSRSVYRYAEVLNRDIVPEKKHKTLACFYYRVG